jgi:1,4-dihydroxy-2-naphthoate polyprenyltransferase
MPALMKGFLDRILTPGFAFAHAEGGGWRGLLSGKSALIVNTMDTPPWIHRWLLRAPGTRMMRLAVLGFCGIQDVHSVSFGPVRDSTSDERSAWLEEVDAVGGSLRQRFRDGCKARLAAWMKAFRPQFHFVPQLCVYVGATLAARQAGVTLDVAALIITMIAALFMEFIAVLTNELNDRRTDELNTAAGPFNGGSRVLVESRLTPRHLSGALLLTSVLLLLTTGVLWLVAPAAAPLLTLLILAGWALAYSYTGRPLQLVYRGLGEPTVAFTNGTYVLALGMASQAAAFPWVLFVAVALPLFFSILPSITLAGFPDSPADEAAGKKTLAVLCGRKTASHIAIAAALIAGATFMAMSPASWPWKLAAGAHAILLVFALGRYRQAGCRPGRIDLLLVLALSFILWFVLGPWLSIPSTRPGLF